MYGIDHPLIPQTTQRTIGNRTSGDEGARVCWGCDRGGIPLREVSSEVYETDWRGSCGESSPSTSRLGLI